MSVLTNWGGTAASWDAAAQGAGFMHTDDYMNSTNWLGISKADNPFSKGNLTGLFSKEGLGNMVKGALPSVGMGVLNMGVNMLAGQNHSAVGDVMQTVSGLASNIPGVGGLIGGAVGVVGGLVNAAFGSHINEEFVNQTRNQANQIGSNVFNANTNADLLNDWGNLTEQSSVRKSEVGSDGWFSSKASRKTDELNRQIAEANRRQLANFNVAAENVDTQNDFRIMQNMAAYGGPIGSFRRFYANGGSLFDTPEFFTFEPQTYGKGGYLNQAKALIRENEGWSAKPYADSPKGKNWRSIGYGFNDSGFRDKYPEGISKHYEHGITKKQAEEELDYFLKKAEKQLKSIYGKQWDDFSDSQKAAILDTYYQRPASVGKSSRFYKAVTAGEDAGRYLGVAGYSRRNNIRQSVFGGAGFSGGAYEDESESLSYPSPILEVTSPITELDLSGIEPTKVINPEINLSYPSLDLNFLTSSQKPVQQQVPTVGTVEDFLASYDDFEQNLFAHGGRLGKYFEGEGEEPNSLKAERSPHVDLAVNNPWLYNKLHPKKKKEKYEPTTFAGRIAQVAGASELGQKYTDYTSSVVQQVPVVGLGVSALDLGYDTNRLYHNPSLGATKDVALDAASLLPALRKTLKGWWMKGNSGSFITEGGQVINNPRLASSLEVMLQPYRTAINTGVYTGRAADFIDDSKAYLQEMWNSSPVGKWANSHDEGGHLAKPTLTNNKVDFSNQLNPLQQKDNVFDGGGWMDFLNSWNQSQGGNNYFGNNWKPSDGLQRNTSNGNAGDWLGVASSVVNTIGNWGKEDPSLGRGGGYSQFGMAAYDLMKTIRDATKHRKEPMDKKLGIPIYCQGGRLFAEGGSVGAMGYAQIGTSALKLASNVKHQASLDDDIDEGKIHRSIDRFGMGLDEAVANVNTNGDLLDLWEDNVTVNPNLGMRDFRDKSLFDDFLDSYAASWEGFNAGQNFGPWGAAIGAIIGGGSSVIGSIIGRNKASNAADEANAKIERANERRFNNLLAAADRVDQENDFRILQNMGANGGKLSMGFGLKNPFVMPDGIATPLYRAFGGGLTHGADFDTGINWVEEGGSHGQNPLGGVPMGVDESGVPNLVEEDEAIWNGDYVFSRRMKVPKKLREKYNLSDDATFADAVKKLTKESEERPLDIISRNTQDHILGELADSQEEMRMAKAQRKMEKEQQLQDDFLTGVQFGLGGHMTPMGLVPNEDNTSFFELLNKQFAEGGGIHIDPSKRGTFKAQASKMGMGVQEAASHILAHKGDYSPEMVKKAVFAHNFAHAFGGSLFEDGGFMTEAEMDKAAKNAFVNKTTWNDNIPWTMKMDAAAGKEAFNEMYGNILNGSFFADGGDLFTNPFAYGGAMGNVFEGEGNRPNILNLDAANQSLVRRIFGDTGFTRFMENTSAALNDPLSYFAGDEINAVIDKLGKMSEPQLERFFRTDIGRAIAPYLAGGDNSQVQEAGMRGAKSVANIVRRVQRPVQIAAKKAMAQSRQAARGQMRTPKGGGSQKVLNETTTPVQQVRQPIRNSGLPEGWGVGSSNLGRASGRTQAFQRGLPKDTFDKGFGSARNLAGTMDFGPAPIGSGNFGYLPWAAGIGAGGYGLYKGIDWLADNLTNPDGTITGVNDPATQAAINSLPSEATSNRGNGNKGKAAVTETSAITPEETGAASTRRGSQGTSKERGNGSGTATRNRGSVVPFTYDWYRNGSDGYSKPWGFIVGQNGLIDKNTGYTDDYRNLVATLGAKDIKEWAKNHADDPSLRSFLDNNYKGKNYVEKLNAFVNDDKFTDDMWRRGATDGKYGFMHHVADEIGKDQLPEFKAPSFAVPEDTSLPEQGLLVFDPKIMGNPKAMAAGTRSTITDPNGTKVTRVTGDGTSDNGLQRNPFKPKQTWTRYAPIAMNALFGLKEMLTPADYGNADAIMAAAYQAGSPVSIGTEYIGDYRKRDPFDETYLMNIINQNSRAANRNFMNISGGNRAAAMSGILANDLVTQRSLAEAARQAYLANRTDDAQVSEFNRGTNIFNAQAQNQRNQFLAQLNSQRQNAMLSGIAQGARLRQAIKDQRDAAISANLTNFAQGLGDLGKENGYYNMLGGLNEEGILKYFYGDDWRTKFNNVNV